MKKFEEHKKLEHLIYLGTIGFTFILFVVIGSLIILDSDTFNEEQTVEDNSVQDILDPLLVDDQEIQTPILINDLNSIKLESKTIRIPEPYKIDTAYTIINPSSFTCAEENNVCTVYEIVNPEEDRRYYASFPGAIEFDESLNDTSTIPIEAVGKSLELIGPIVTLADETGVDTGDILYQELSSCIPDLLCFNSGLLTLDLEINQSEIVTFTQFLSGLAIE